MSKLDKWDRRFLSLAKEISTWSKDPNASIGTVITDSSNHIVSFGFNGFPKGIDDSAVRLGNVEVKNKLMIHGELNAMLNATQSLNGCTIYIHGKPACHECAKVIIQQGITRVVYDTAIDHNSKWVASMQLVTELFEEARIELTILGD